MSRVFGRRDSGASGGGRPPVCGGSLRGRSAAPSPAYWRASERGGAGRRNTQVLATRFSSAYDRLREHMHIHTRTSGHWMLHPCFRVLL